MQQIGVLLLRLLKKSHDKILFYLVPPPISPALEPGRAVPGTCQILGKAVRQE